MGPFPRSILLQQLPAMSRQPIVLFTAFEPSGDDHASSVIAALRARRPDIRVFAWGGPKMQAAGAIIVERTGDDAVMGVPGLKKIHEHRLINRRVAEWISVHRPDLHVPVDSPAANFPICEAARARGVRIVHVVAPQIWAWGPWRIGKLRRLTDLVLCLLPFEEGWFTTRGVPAHFIGHPIFDHAVDEASLDRIGSGFPVARAGEWKLALMPGSRPSELERNFPLMLDAFRLIRKSRPHVIGMVAARNEVTQRRLESIAARVGGWPDGLHCAAGKTEAVIRWCHLSIVVSGTVTLQIARQARPMVIQYVANPWFFHAVARWIVKTKFFTLPNLIMGHEVAPEYVPHLGGPEPIADAAMALIDDPIRYQRQIADLREIARRFEGRNAAEAAAVEIDRMLQRP